MGDIMDKENLIIRTINATDYLELLPLVNQLGYNLSENDLLINIKKYLDNTSNVIFIAQFENKIVGFISLDIAQRFYLHPFVDVSGIAVDINYRKLGIGKALVFESKKWAIGMGFSKIILKSGAVRKDAHQFYEKLGFNKTKEQYVFDLNLS